MTAVPIIPAWIVSVQPAAALLAAAPTPLLLAAAGPRGVDFPRAPSSPLWMASLLGPSTTQVPTGY